MLGDLSPNIIGANPQYPKIVDHSWLDVNLAAYDNYPSDNNPVRVVPKLHDLWNHGQQTGLTLIPNAQVLPLGVRSSTEDEKTVKALVREAKKAVMAGLKGKALTEHLRSRFASRYIDLAKGELQKVAQEIGLLGNVYIDVTAFESYGEAERFLSQNRTRLARDMLLNEGYNPNTVSMLASEFHKNIVTSVDYNEPLFRKYHDHLVQAGRIPKNFVINSRETLRQAFLYEQPVEPVVSKKQEEKSLTAEETDKVLSSLSEEQKISDRDASDAVLLHTITPVISFVQEHLAKGKKKDAIKEMVKGKFAFTDVKAAAQALSIVLSDEGVSPKNIDSLITDGIISSVLGAELKKIGSKFPVVQKPVFEGVTTQHQVGVPGYLYAMEGKNVSDKYDIYRTAAVEALKKGIEPDKIQIKLCQKLSSDEADQVLASAVRQLNSQPAGAIANKKEKSKKAVLFSEPVQKPTLPDPSTIEPAIQEVLSYTTGGEMAVAVDSPVKVGSSEVGELFNREGMDKSF